MTILARTRWPYVEFENVKGEIVSLWLKDKVHNVTQWITHSTATPSHVHLGITLGHDNSIIVGTVGTRSSILARLNFDVGNVYNHKVKRMQIQVYNEWLVAHAFS